MRVCDKCGEKAVNVVSADNQIFDLCKEHHTKLLEFLTVADKPKRIGRPPKNPDQVPTH